MEIQNRSLPTVQPSLILITSSFIPLGTPAREQLVLPPLAIERRLSRLTRRKPYSQVSFILGESGLCPMCVASLRLFPGNAMRMLGTNAVRRRGTRAGFRASTLPWVVRNFGWDASPYWLLIHSEQPLAIGGEAVGQFGVSR